MALIQTAANTAIEAQKYFDELGDSVMYLVTSKGNLFGMFVSLQSATDFVESQQVEGKNERVGYVLPIFMNGPWVWTHINQNFQFGEVTDNMNALLTKMASMKNISHRFGTMELLFAYIMQNPEIVARHPSLRETMDIKIKDATKAIKTNKLFPKSVVILEDYKQFIEAIKTRKDYVKYEVQKRYNLRSMAKKKTASQNGF